MATRDHFVFPIDAKHHKVHVNWDLNGSMANMNLIGVFVTKLWPVQALACGGGGDGGGTKNIIPPKFSNFGDIITGQRINGYLGGGGGDVITLLIMLYYKY